MSIRQYLFAGDAGIAQATQVPTMSGAGDNKVLSVQTDLGAYNCWQKCILDDNVYETYRQEVLPEVNNWTVTEQPGANVASRGAFINEYLQPHTLHQGKVTFNFQLMGMTSMKRIFLDYVANLKVGYQPFVEGAVIGTNPNPICTAISLDSFNGQRPSDIAQPEYAMLDCIRRVQFCIGKEKLIFEDGSVESIRARKVHTSSLNLQPQEAAQIARLGLRYAKNLTNSYNSKFEDANGVRNWTFANGNIFNREINAASASIFNHISADLGTSDFKSLDEYQDYYNSYIQNIQNKRPGTTINYPTGGNQTWLEVPDGNAPTVIPLFCLIPFLAQSDTYLPKGLPIEIRLDFEFYSGRNSNLASQQLFSEYKRNGAINVPDRVNLLNQFAANFAYDMRPIAGLQNHNDRVDSAFLYYDGTNTVKSTIRLVYDYFILKENLLKEFNLTWLKQPLLYNYYKWRRYDMVDFAGGPTTSISYNLLINQQRPLCVYLRFETIRTEQFKNYTRTGTPNFSDITVGGNTYEYGGQMRGCVVNAMDNAVNRVPRIRFANPIVNYLTGSCAGPAMNLIECYIGSQLIYRADVKSQTNINGYTVHSTMDSLHQSSRDNSADVVECAQLRQEMTMYDNACPYKIVLTQNKAYERGFYALDRGNTNLKFTIRLDENLDVTKYTLAMYACYPAQMTIDKSYSAVESQWPVIIAQNGPLVQTQYNIN